MFRHTQAYYDAIYTFKDYAEESRKIRALIRRYQRSGGNTLLDVACGTGVHMGHLRRHYRVEGLDLDPAMLRIARARLKGVTLHRGDMRTFDLGKEFDAVICLFSSVGYMRGTRDLDRAVAAMARHARPGGVVVVEPWLTPKGFQQGHFVIQTGEAPGLKIARAARTARRERRSEIKFHYVIADRRGIRTVDEVHNMTLFTEPEYRRAFRRAGLTVRFDKRGLMGRGLYVGLKPP